MSVDLVSWASHVYLLLAALLALMLLGLLAWTVIVALKWTLQRRQANRAERLARQRRLMFPPAGRGMCDGCGKVHDEVFHLSTGRRLCPACYRAEGALPAVADPRPGGSGG